MMREMMTATLVTLTCQASNSSATDLIVLGTYQEIGWDEHLQNHLFCVDWDVKP